VRLGSRQRTSRHPTSSILKADASLRFGDQLRAHGIECLQDMADLSAARESAVETAIRAIRGQGSGLSWNYFRMLSGSEDLVKANRMVLRFVAAALGRPIASELASELVRGAASELHSKYSHLTPRLLDGAIWSYQSELAASNRPGRGGTDHGQSSSDVFGVGGRHSPPWRTSSPPPAPAHIGSAPPIDTNVDTSAAPPTTAEPETSSRQSYR
jgi:hypothetical protein